MESKYKERAKELLIPYSEELLSNQFLVKAMQSDIIKEMCKLAEEVEKETVDQFFGNPGYTWYTKEQVEELLQKQRELSYKETITDCEEIDWDRWEHKVDKDSILNAKLKID